LDEENVTIGSKDNGNNVVGLEEMKENGPELRPDPEILTAVLQPQIPDAGDRTGPKSPQVTFKGKVEAYDQITKEQIKLGREKGLGELLKQGGAHVEALSALVNEIPKEDTNSKEPSDQEKPDNVVPFRRKSILSKEGKLPKVLGPLARLGAAAGIALTLAGEAKAEPLKDATPTPEQIKKSIFTPFEERFYNEPTKDMIRKMGQAQEVGGLVEVLISRYSILRTNIGGEKAGIIFQKPGETINRVALESGNQVLSEKVFPNFTGHEIDIIGNNVVVAGKNLVSGKGELIVSGDLGGNFQRIECGGEFHYTKISADGQYIFTVGVDPNDINNFINGVYNINTGAWQQLLGSARGLFTTPRIWPSDPTSYISYAGDEGGGSGYIKTKFNVNNGTVTGERVEMSNPGVEPAYLLNRVFNTIYTENGQTYELVFAPSAFEQGKGAMWVHKRQGDNLISREKVVPNAVNPAYPNDVLYVMGGILDISTDKVIMMVNSQADIRGFLDIFPRTNSADLNLRQVIPGDGVAASQNGWGTCDVAIRTRGGSRYLDAASQIMISRNIDGGASPTRPWAGMNIDLQTQVDPTVSPTVDPSPQPTLEATPTNTPSPTPTPTQRIEYFFKVYLPTTLKQFAGGW